MFGFKLFALAAYALIRNLRLVLSILAIPFGLLLLLNLTVGDSGGLFDGRGIDSAVWWMGYIGWDGTIRITISPSFAEIISLFSIFLYPWLAAGWIRGVLLNEGGVIGSPERASLSLVLLGKCLGAGIVVLFLGTLYSWIVYMVAGRPEPTPELLSPSLLVLLLAWGPPLVIWVLILSALTGTVIDPSYKVASGWDKMIGYIFPISLAWLIYGIIPIALVYLLIQVPETPAVLARLITMVLGMVYWLLGVSLMTTIYVHYVGRPAQT